MKIADIEATLVDHMGSDLSVVNAARVSFHKESSWLWDDEYQEYQEGVLKKSDAGLIRYLATHKHFSPFNHSFITCRVKAPIFVARQLVKHKFMPWNEVSRRYVDEEPEFYFRKFHSRAANLKQGSTGEIIELPYKNYLDGIELQLANYQEAIDLGAAPEDARMLLPQSMMTEWVWSGTLGAYCDMLRLRLEHSTQFDSRIVAEKVRAIIEPLFPVSVPALLDIK